MKEVTLMVTNSTARLLDSLVETGRITRKTREGYEAYCLAMCSRPIKGERWLRVGGDLMWKRLPKRLSYGG
jgi:hypothetical protein